MKKNCTLKQIYTCTLCKFTIYNVPQCHSTQHPLPPQSKATKINRCDGKPNPKTPPPLSSAPNTAALRKQSAKHQTLTSHSLNNANIAFIPITIYYLLYSRFRYSFTRQGTLTRRQRSDPSVPESSRHSSPPVQLLKGRGNPAKCPTQGHNKRTRRPIPTPNYTFNKSDLLRF